MVPLAVFMVAVLLGMSVVGGRWSVAKWRRGGMAGAATDYRPLTQVAGPILRRGRPAQDRSPRGKRRRVERCRLAWRRGGREGGWTHGRMGASPGSLSGG